MIIKRIYTKEDLLKMNDDELVEVIYAKAYELDYATFGQNFSDAQSIFKEIYCMWQLEADVMNGGFDQYFENDGIELVDTILSGCKKISATYLEKILLKAKSVYINQDESFKTKRNPAFNELDMSFLRIETELERDIIKYIRSNYDDFIVN